MVRLCTHLRWKSIFSKHNVSRLVEVNEAIASELQLRLYVPFQTCINETLQENFAIRELGFQW